MTDRPGFRCYMIGADTLLIECAERVLAKGHDLRGIVSDEPRLVRWAKSRNVPALDTKTYKDALVRDPFDYLFAITHLAILPDDVLVLPAKAAINFHDGPLPRYAGLNTPAWALMNREREYGISFHLIASGVDTGDLLKQRRFEVAAQETSLSINTRCFEAGLEAFDELVDELAGGTAVRSPQDPTQRTYFAKNDRPKAAAVLDFGRPAAELEALVRALDFGKYRNPLARAKIVHRGKVAVVTHAEAREGQGGAPGTVQSLDDDGLVAATADGLLALKSFAELGGRPLSIKEAAGLLEVREGDRLEGLPADVAERLSTLNAELARHEAFWVKRLVALEPMEVPRARSESEASTRRYDGVALELPSDFRARFSDVASLVALATVHLSRVGQKDAFDIGFRGEETGAGAVGLAPFVAPFVPLRAEVASSSPFPITVERVREALTIVAKRRTFVADVAARHPELSSLDTRDHRLLPFAIDVVGDGGDPAPGTALVLRVSEGATSLVFDTSRLDRGSVEAIAREMSFLGAQIAAESERPVATLELLDPAARKRVLVDANDTAAPYARDACMHTEIEAAAARHPSRVALVCEGESIRYRELEERANQLAHRLRELGVGADDLVAVSIERSIDLVVSCLAVQKAGGAYVPLDPAYPVDRLAFMLEDSKAKVLLTRGDVANRLPVGNTSVVRLDLERDTLARRATTPPAPLATPTNLAYVIYTSGSTGKPKGVMIEHRNVVNFFAAMDAKIERRTDPSEPPGTWLAVTSLSFDISVLELFWTLSRGFEVVIYVDQDRKRASATDAAVDARPMQFGLFYWGNDDREGARKYELLLEGARLADRRGFSAVWTPERHFHAFGGPYPNPAVTGAAVAAITSRVAVRAGSCVLPLHSPIRVAEEWAVLDNLSNGRVGLSVAAGWQPDDFILRPENAPPNNKTAMLRDTEVLRRLWRGERVEFDMPNGRKVGVVTQPRPVQKDLPIWVTTAGNPETFRQAGEIGANVLTHLLGQSVEEVGEKVRVYREARRAAGLDPAAGTFTLMLHTFIGDDTDEVREIVRKPMKDYLRASMSLIKQFAWAFPAFKRPKGVAQEVNDVDLQALSEDETETLLDFAFERYFETSGLFGTIDVCLAQVRKLKEIGVDEIACLIDYGVPSERVLGMLGPLATLRDRANEHVGTVIHAETAGDHGFAALVTRHHVTHFQCTPSMARMLLSMPDTKAALGHVAHVMIGGEAFPRDVANALLEGGCRTVTNMYGPTETTIWSTTQSVTSGSDPIPIGRPIANTQVYVLDRFLKPMPPGVPGELYIGGDGVVRGYHERASLTAERFVADPFRAGGARMYRTGDLARLREDGVVEFLGRTDHQVKIRGYRIELGEIEVVIAAYDGVHETVVIAREDSPGDQRLVAYVVPKDGDAKASTVAPAAVREHVRSILPEHMVPAHVVLLDALPLTPNGKIDRKQLPAPEADEARPSAVFVAPESDIERTIAEVWREALGLAEVGTEDNFFDIGGHSLLVVRVHRSLKERITEPVTLTDLYRFPTIKSLAQHLASDGENEALSRTADRAKARRDAMRRRR